MKLLITGAAGMIGRRLAEKIAETSRIGGLNVSSLTLVDVIAPAAAQTFKGSRASIAADLSQDANAAKLIAERPDMIVHLAAVVSGEAEADLSKGYQVNLDGTRALFEAIAAIEGYRPRVIFASSLAVFGPPFPDRIPDDCQVTPLTSYGTQKAMGELLLNDYARRGFLDGIGIRFPTICIRPGKPNKAASGFYSSILREPLNGKEAVLPVSRALRHWFASPRSAVGYIEHAATMDTAPLGSQRCLTMPGVTATVQDQIDALRDVAGEAAVALIRDEPDPVIEGILGKWPRDFDTRRANDLGFRAEKTFREIIDIYLEEEAGPPARQAAAQ